MAFTCFKILSLAIILLCVGTHAFHTARIMRRELRQILQGTSNKATQNGHLIDHVLAFQRPYHPEYAINKDNAYETEKIHRPVIDQNSRGNYYQSRNTHSPVVDHGRSDYYKTQRSNIPAIDRSGDNYYKTQTIQRPVYDNESSSPYTNRNIHSVAHNDDKANYYQDQTIQRPVYNNERSSPYKNRNIHSVAHNDDKANYYKTQEVISPVSDHIHNKIPVSSYHVRRTPAVPVIPPTYNAHHNLKLPGKVFFGPADPKYYYANYKNKGFQNKDKGDRLFVDGGIPDFNYETTGGDSGGQLVPYQGQFVVKVPLPSRRHNDHRVKQGFSPVRYRYNDDRFDGLDCTKHHCPL